jgi:hypothetical protein
MSIPALPSGGKALLTRTLLTPPLFKNSASGIRNLYLIAICLLALVGTVSFLAGSWTRVMARFELDYGEGIVMWQAAHVTNLKTAYGDIAHEPYIVFHYTPIYPLVSHLAARWTHDLLIAGRLVSVFSALIIILIFAAQVFTCLPRRTPVSARLSGAFTAIVLSYCLTGLDWARLMRVDFLGLLFTFTGLALFILSRRRAAWEYTAFVFFFLALFTKQSLIAAPLACLTASFIVDRRRAWRLAATIAGCSIATLCLLWLATDGRVLRHLILYNRNPSNLRQFIVLMHANLNELAPLLAIAVGALVSYAVRILRFPGVWVRIRAGLRQSPYQRDIIVGGLHLALAFLVSFTALKQGSNYNYFLEWNLATVPLAGLLVGRTVAGLRQTSDLTGVVAVLLLIPVSLGLRAIRKPGIPEAVKNQPYSRVLDRIEQAHGPVYSEDMVLLNLAGKKIYGEPSILSSLTAEGTWDETPLVKQIRSGFFALIVQKNPNDPLYYSLGVQSAIRDAYQISERDGDYTLSVRRRQAAAQPGSSAQ